MGDLQPNHTLNNSEAVQVSGNIMVAAIIVLFFVMVFVLFLHLYARWFWSRRADGSPSRPRRRFVFAPSQDPVIGMHQGLEPSVIRSLPVLIFHPDEFKDGLECAVCLCDLSDGEKARLLPKCSHGFHVDCIDMWFQSHSTCPLCRDPVSLESTNSSLESPEIQTLEDNSTAGHSRESLNFPTNVLFWGNETQVSTRGSGQEEGPSSAPHSSSPITMPEGTLMIEIPRHLSEGIPSSSPSASRYAEEELKSPMTTRLRSLRRLLSREKRVIPGSPSSFDVEQGEGGRAQSSKTTLDS